MSRVQNRRRKRRRMLSPLHLVVSGVGAISCSHQEPTRPAPEPTQVATEPLNSAPKLSDFVIDAQNSVRLQSGGLVNGGDIAAQGTGSGPFLSGGVAVDVSTGAKVQTTHNVIADSVRLGSGAAVGDVQTDRLVDSGSKHGKVTPLVPLPPLPAPSPVTPGTKAVNVATGATASVSPGHFGSVTVGSGAKLRLGAGAYDVADVTIGSGARVEALGAVQLHVANRLSTSDGVFVGPASGAALKAGDIRVEVSGRNGSTGDLGATPKAASFGSGAQLTALLLVPNGTLVLGTGVQATGAFVGRDVDVGTGGALSFQSGFAGATCTPASCDDGNPCTVDACGASGACTHTAAANGTACTGTNKCEQSYSCQGGACTGSSPVTCAAADACHVAGTCDPASGTCSNPAAPDGTGCNDGNACTRADTCRSGTCTGTNPIACAASDQCHTAGTCNPSTGTCSNPSASDGTACNDGNACTQSDTCQSGTCTGTSPVTCAAADACHVAGTCDPASGTCSNPAAPDGTGCNDGNACTQADACNRGACVGSNPVACTASDACHVAGTCDPSSGGCSNPPAADGTACSDGNACTSNDACSAGTCVSGPQVVCAGDQCRGAGSCDATTGACLNPAKPDGTPCDDANACTKADACEQGQCVGGNPVVCVAQDECHDPGACDPAAGQCSNPAKQGATCSALPPDPATVAPPLDPSVATNLADATQFLYSGATPIQVGLAAGTIERPRAAVLRGQVQSREGAPLPGVTVSVHGHPEFGTTRSRSDGAFDMVVNGGGFLTLDYQKTGYLPAQRRVQAPWLDYAKVPDAALIPLDPSVTEVDLTSTKVQVARGSLMVDGSGPRRMTLLFLPGTQATMTLANCQTQALNALSVRATEYTVGPNGPMAMPAALPATSQYTYAVELSADEAISAGATRIDFTRPVIGYVENFLHFAVGTSVPLGFYDDALAQWKASDSGRVVQVLGSTSGLADLDTNGDGQPDDEATLAQLGITDDERRFLSTSYQVGASLWRTPLQHFSHWDANQGWAPPPDANPPGQPPPARHGPTDHPDCQGGCIIEAQNQSLGESIAITGTPFALVYRSDRVVGWDSSGLQIALSGASVPASLKTIHLEVSTAGSAAVLDFPPTPNQSFSYRWDGNDAYGRPLLGQPRTYIDIGYVYDGFYAKVPRFGYDGNGIPITGDGTRNEITLHQALSLDGAVGGGVSRWDARGQGLGGWTLDIHNVYDSQRTVLRLGDGTSRTAESLHAAVVTTAGSDSIGFRGDGGPAKDALMNLVGCGYGCAGVAVAPDGGYYIADVGNCRVRRVRSDGVIETVAGTGTCDLGDPEPDSSPATCGSNTDPTALSVNLSPVELTVAGDGSVYVVSSPASTVPSGNINLNYGDLASKIYRLDVPSGTLRRVAGNGTSGVLDEDVPATGALLRARDVAVAPDGAIYVADTGNNKVRRVGADGFISTIAGNGTRGFGGDGPVATATPLADPTGVTVGPDGAVYIADQGNSRIRRVRPDGSIETVAGGGVGQGEGIPAGSAGLGDPIDVALAPDGSLYFAEPTGTSTVGPSFGAGRVRRVTPAGLIETVAGGGNQPPYLGETQPATSVGLKPSDVDVAADGSACVESGNRILLIAPPLPGVGFTDSFIASEDGGTIYVFDKVGRHARTVHPLTGAALLTFSYDAGGRLASVTDASGNTTSIQRDAQGGATSVTSPYGQVTQLVLDTDGYLAAVVNPVGEATRMTYANGGLLSSFTNPRGGIDQFAYDGAGRLVKDTDPAGGVKTSERTDDAAGYRVTETTALGRVTVFSVQGPSGGSRVMTDTRADGSQVVEHDGTDDSVATQAADGTTRVVTQSPDPRFGMQSPLAQSVMQTPSGLVSTTTTSRQVTQSNPDDPLSVQSVVDQVVVNGSVFASQYDATSLQFTRTTPMGRQLVDTIDHLGRIVEREVPGMASTFFSYDAHGRLSTITQGTGTSARVATFTYDTNGRLATVTDPLSRTTQFTRDSVGRPLAVVLPGGREVDYTYDANSNVTSVTPPGRPAHVFSFTPLDQVAQYSPPSVGTGNWATGYSYSADSELTQVTRPDTRLVKYSYDPTSARPTSVSYPAPVASSSSVETVVPTYDGAGRVSTLTSGSGVVLTYGYDGPLVTSESWSGAVAGTVGRAYDANFRPSQETVNGAAAVAFAYDGDGLLVQAGDLTLGRDPGNGFLVGAVLGSVTETFDYDAFGELQHHSAAGPGSSTLLAIAYQRDALGRITQKTETILGATSTFAYTYDAADRLQSVSKDGVETAGYTYDANGNRNIPSGASGTATYDDQDRLLQYGDTTFTYRANGELLSKTTPDGTTQYAYDALGNLRQVTLPDGTLIEYLVDGRNRRVGKKANGTLVQAFLYENALSPVAELDGSGNVVSRFVYGTQGNVPEYMVRGGTTYRFVTDHLGSPRLVVDAATGNVAQQIDYDDWGTVLEATGVAWQPFGFSGGIYDIDTRLVRFGARDYDTEIGRWIAKDPVRFSGGDTSLYGFVFNDPTNYLDPAGLWAATFSGSAYAGLGGGFSLTVGSNGISVSGELGGGFGTSWGAAIAPGNVDTSSTAVSFHVRGDSPVHAGVDFQRGFRGFFRRDCPSTGNVSVEWSHVSVQANQAGFSFGGTGGASATVQVSGGATWSSLWPW